jgi:hypothetical protein
VFGFESTEYTLTYGPPICEATFPYSFSPATTVTTAATFPAALAAVDAALGFDPELHAAPGTATDRAATPVIALANLHTLVFSRGRQLSGSISDNVTSNLESLQIE